MPKIIHIISKQINAHIIIPDSPSESYLVPT